MAIVVELHVSIQTTGFALRAFVALSRSSLRPAGSPEQEDSEPDSSSSDSEQASGVVATDRKGDIKNVEDP